MLKTISIIGGDRREIVLTGALAREGYKIRVLSDKPLADLENVFYFNNMTQVIKNTDVVIAPMSSTDKDGFLKAVFTVRKVKLDQNFFELLPDDCLFLIGMANSHLQELLNCSRVKYVEMAKIDELAILNAIPTAEGAIKIAIEETPFTIYKSNILILGLGKVGLTLAWRLKLLGAEVFSATRNGEAIARGKDLGFNMLNYHKLSDYLPEMDIIFNTVPAMIIGENYLAKINKDAIIIDLASNPGGTDFKIADQKGIKAMLAPGLPGKVAPVTAGEILSQIIPEIISDPGKYL